MQRAVQALGRDTKNASKRSLEVARAGVSARLTALRKATQTRTMPAEFTEPLLAAAY